MNKFDLHFLLRRFHTRGSGFFRKLLSVRVVNLAAPLREVCRRSLDRANGGGYDLVSSGAREQNLCNTDSLVELA